MAKVKLFEGASVKLRDGTTCVLTPTDSDHLCDLHESGYTDWVWQSSSDSRTWNKLGRYCKSVVDSWDIVEVLSPEDAPDAPVGIKHGTDKLKFSLLTHDLAEQVKEVVKVLTHGAKKYSPRGWQKLDNPIRRYTDALYRHLNKWHQGETHDPETGCHHLAHAVCNLMFMMYFSMTRLNKTED